MAKFQRDAFGVSAESINCGEPFFNTQILNCDSQAKSIFDIEHIFNKLKSRLHHIS